LQRPLESAESQREGVGASFLQSFVGLVQNLFLDDLFFPCSLDANRCGTDLFGQGEEVVPVLAEKIRRDGDDDDER
jgi:hypothetical protein